MGACATKPRDLKEEGEAPLPLEAQENKEDKMKHTSLGHLFSESEKRREATKSEEITVQEAISTTSQEETKGEEEEQTKAQMHPTQDSETAETKDSETFDVEQKEQKEEAVEERGNVELDQASSTTEKKGDAALPSSTTETG